jgi:predicted phage replisome organizer
MAENKRYYWLKLKRDFFRRHDIQIVENMPNGKDYILFYLKLLCESVDHNGNLRFSEQIPYNEQMLATITNTNIDVVRSAIQVFEELGMMEVLDDGTYFMNEVQKMLGSETKWAEKKRDYRLKKGQCPQGVLPMSDKSKRESIEKDIDKEKENTKESSSLFDFEDAWKKTFDIYPKKTAYSTSKTAWMDKVLEVIEENQPDIARLLYKATEAYLSDYQEKNPDDTDFRYIPKYVDWLKNDCDYWLQIAEKRGDDS